MPLSLRSRKSPWKPDLRDLAAESNKLEIDKIINFDLLTSFANAVNASEGEKNRMGKDDERASG